jgi:hypothetical protein
MEFDTGAMAFVNGQSWVVDRTLPAQRQVPVQTDRLASFG